MNLQKEKFILWTGLVQTWNVEQTTILIEWIALSVWHAGPWIQCQRTMVVDTDQMVLGLKMDLKLDTHEGTLYEMGRC